MWDSTSLGFCGWKIYLDLPYTIKTDFPLSSGLKANVIDYLPFPLLTYIYIIMIDFRDISVESIHKAQRELFGDILRAPDKCLEDDCCCATAFCCRAGEARGGF